MRKGEMVSRRVPWLTVVPLLIFASVGGLFVGGMFWTDGDELPSTLIGQPAPDVPEQGLSGKTLFLQSDLSSGSVTLVNYWASWCPPCRAEHPTLEALASEGIRIAGVNFRDQEDDALEYLVNEGDPFFAHGFDPRGRTSIDWGVTAPPETFIVDGTGTVLFRFAGPLIGADYEQRFLPAMREALSVD